MRKFTLTLLVILAFGSLSFGLGATAKLTPLVTTASPNENVAINLQVTNFNSIGSFQFYVQVDPAVMTFINVTGFTHTGLPDMSPPTVIYGNTVTLLWTSTTPHTWADGTLLTLNFKYKGLTSPISFDVPNCEVASGMPPIPIAISYTNASISPFMGNTEQAHIGTVSAATGSNISVPVTYTGAGGTSVGAITQRIAYDPGKLTFINVTGSGQLNSGSLSTTPSSGIVEIVWSNPAGVSINTLGTRFNVNFQYTGSTTTIVSFSTGCEIVTPSVPATNIPVTYNSGSVAPLGPPTAFASLPVLTTAVQGQLIDVPLTLTGMPSNTTNFNINLTYDNPRMSFVGAYNAIQPVLAVPNGNTIAITNVNPLTAIPSINGQFLVLRFKYNGVGKANITFASDCQFNNGSTIVVGYTNGSVSPALATGNANIGTLSATSPSAVSIPVTFDNMPTNIGSVQMKIKFDATKLTYVNASPSIVSITGDVLTIFWSSTTPTNINGTFITLNFNYAAASNASTQVTFTDGCEVSYMSGTTPVIVPTNWNNGGVNSLFKLSGVLKYDNHPPYPNTLAGFTVTLKTSPGDVFVGTTTTNASGYYEFMVANGSYKITTTAPVSATWFASEASSYLIFYYANGYDLIPDPTPLKYLAGDVNLDGWMFEDDAYDVFYRANGYLLPDYLAPDWLFQIPVVTVSGTNLPNQDYFGICSGDVAGEGPIF